MDRLIDEIVEVRVKDALASATATSVNTAAVLGVSTKGATSVVYSKSEVNTEYDGDLAKVASTFFDEEGNPGRLVCIPVSQQPTVSNIYSLLDTAINVGRDTNNREVDFYHVILRVADSTSADDIEELVKGTEDHDGLSQWCQDNFRIAYIEISSRTLANSVIAKFTANPPKRVYFVYHSETLGKSLAAAIVANRCGSDPARGTFAHTHLTSVIADATTKAQLKDAEDNGLNIYCRIAGVDRFYFGAAVGGTDFIDSQIKKDWIKFRVQESVFNLLGSANNGDGVDYGDVGFDAVEGAINEVFVIATDNTHRYVMPDSYEITVPKYSEISAEDKQKRNLSGIKVTFDIQNSLHTVKTIELQVNE